MGHDPHDRTDREREVHHPAHRPQGDQVPTEEHRDGGRPGRVPATRDPAGAGEERDRVRLRALAPRHIETGPRRHHDRRDPGQRNRPDRRPRGAHRAPRLLFRARQRRRVDDRAPRQHRRRALPGGVRGEPRGGAAVDQKDLHALQGGVRAGSRRPGRARRGRLSRRPPPWTRVQAVPKHRVRRAGRVVRGPAHHRRCPGHDSLRPLRRPYPGVRGQERDDPAAAVGAAKSCTGYHHTRGSVGRRGRPGVTMPVFEYEVVDSAGTIGRGRQQAEDSAELLQQFRDRGQLVVSLRATDAPSAAPLRDVLKRSFGGVGGRVRLATLVLFTGQLAAMLEAGLHLVRILTALGRESSDRRFGKIVEDVRDSLAAGNSFADSLRLYPAVFTRLYVAAVHAGEASGALVVVLNTLTAQLEKAEQLRRKVKGALAYPITVLATSLAIVAGMIVYIVPIFEEVYAKANAKLPTPTLVLVAVSRLVRESAVLTVLGVGLVVAAVVMAARTERGRDLLDKLKLRIPLFGPLIRKAVLARTCRTLSMLLQSGLPLMEALNITSQVAGNNTIERALLAVERGVRDGGTLANMMQQTGAFTSLVTQLVSSGEEGGALAAMLGKAAVYYEAQVDASVATLSTLVEPVMILLLGGIAGSVILALYMPIFSLGQAMRGGIK